MGARMAKSWMTGEDLAQKWLPIGTVLVITWREGRPVAWNTVWGCEKGTKFYSDGSTSRKGTTWRLHPEPRSSDLEKDVCLLVRQSYTPRRLNPAFLLRSVELLRKKAMKAQEEVSEACRALFEEVGGGPIIARDPDRVGLLSVSMYIPSEGNIWWPSDNTRDAPSLDPVEQLAMSDVSAKATRLIARKRYAERCWVRWSGPTWLLEAIISKQLPTAHVAAVKINGTTTFWRGADAGYRSREWSMQQPSIAYLELDEAGNKVDLGPGRAVITWEPE